MGVECIMMNSGLLVAMESIGYVQGVFHMRQLSRIRGIERSKAGTRVPPRCLDSARQRRGSETGIACPHDGLRPRGHLQLVEHGRYFIAHRLFAQIEVGCNLPVVQTLRQ